MTFLVKIVDYATSMQLMCITIQYAKKIGILESTCYKTSVLQTKIFISEVYRNMLLHISLIIII